jgi:hypothetical protein
MGSLQTLAGALRLAADGCLPGVAVAASERVRAAPCRPPVDPVYQFPCEHWKHLRTSNPVESPFAAVRLRTAAAKRFKKVENAPAVMAS